MKIAIKELERAVKYRERELESFKNKLLLLEEQKRQYEDELIPQFTEEIKELKNTIQQFKEFDEMDLPF